MRNEPHQVGRLAPTIRDSYSGLGYATPTSDRSAETFQPIFKFVAGPAVRNPSVIVKSDSEAGIIAVVEWLGWHPEPSLANRWPHNTVHERWHQTVKSVERAAISQSAFPQDSWGLCITYATTALGVTQQAPILPYEKDAAGNPLPEHAHKVGKTCWFVHHGSDFSGPLQPFGRLVYYLNKDHPMAATTKPGFFIGWKLESGLRYRNVLRILDYDTVVRGKSIAFRSIQDVPEAEVYFPDEVVFPFAERRKLAIRTLQDPSSIEFPQPQIPDSDILPFDEGSGSQPRGEDQSLYDLPKVRREFNITLDRIIKYNPTEGCKACERAGTPGLVHTAECVAKFRKCLQDDGVLPITTVTTVTPPWSKKKTSSMSSICLLTLRRQ